MKRLECVEEEGLYMFCGFHEGMKRGERDGFGLELQERDFFFFFVTIDLCFGFIHCFSSQTVSPLDKAKLIYTMFLVSLRICMGCNTLLLDNTQLFLIY